MAAPALAAAGESSDRCHRNLSCRVHSEKGLAFSEQKNYGAALNEFQAAYDAEPAPRLLLNIGRSLYRLDRPQEALDYYARYRKAERVLDVEAEKVLKRYELDASTALALNNETEPRPAPLRVAPDRFPPRAALGLLGAGLGCLVMGIGLGAGAMNAAKDIGQSINNFTVFGPEPQALELRGFRMQASGITFDVLGILALGAGVASVATWYYLKKSVQDTAQSPSMNAAFSIGSGAAQHAQLLLGGS